jgi:hypothetical protein
MGDPLMRRLAAFPFSLLLFCAGSDPNPKRSGYFPGQRLVQRGFRAGRWRTEQKSRPAFLLMLFAHTVLA